MKRYNLSAMLLHWVQAGLVLSLLWLGLTMIDLPKGAERSAAYGLHKSLGLLAMLLTAVRIGWRIRHPAPPSPLSGWQDVVAKGTHHALYAFLVLAPLAGYLATSFTVYPLKFFGVEVPKVGWPDEALNGTFKSLHWFLVYGGAMLIALHIAAAIKHLALRDGLMQRMLPGGLFRK